MKHASLFTGIGGFDLAAEWMGWENVFHCENNPFCQQVLKKRFPKSIPYGDIKTTDFSIWRGLIGILTGGFPCQPYSAAGNRQGTEDPRHLWPENVRAITEIQPRWVVGENVPGLINWSKGMVFEQVQADLEAAGYEAFPPAILPACGLNAPHRRERVWFVAHRNGDGRIGDNKSSSGYSGQLGQGLEEKYVIEPLHGDGDVANAKVLRKREQADEVDPITDGREAWPMPGGVGGQRTPSDSGSERHRGIQSGGQPRSGKKVRPGRAGNSKIITVPYSSERPEGGMSSIGPGEAERYTGPLDARSYEFGGWDNFPTQSPLRRGDDGISGELDLVGRIEKRDAVHRLKALGNAIVPEVALQLFKIIQEMDQMLHH